MGKKGRSLAARRTGWPVGGGAGGGRRRLVNASHSRLYLQGGRAGPLVAPPTWRDEPGGPPTLPSKAATVRWRHCPSAALTPPSLAAAGGEVVRSGRGSASGPCQGGTARLTDRPRLSSPGGDRRRRWWSTRGGQQLLTVSWEGGLLAPAPGPRQRGGAAKGGGPSGSSNGR